MADKIEEMKTWEQIKESSDPIDRLTYYINGLSPHNLWKAREAIQSYVQQEKNKLLDELVGELPSKETAPDNLEPVETAKRLDDFYKGYNQYRNQAVEIIKGRKNG